MWTPLVGHPDIENLLLQVYRCPGWRVAGTGTPVFHGFASTVPLYPFAQGWHGYFLILNVRESRYLLCRPPFDFFHQRPHVGSSRLQFAIKLFPKTCKSDWGWEMRGFPASWWCAALRQSGAPLMPESSKYSRQRKNAGCSVNSRVAYRMPQIPLSVAPSTLEVECRIRCVQYAVATSAIMAAMVFSARWRPCIGG